MAVFPQLERFIWLDRRLKRQRFPNASHLAERFEVSRKTAQRDICRFRDRFQAPIAYDAAQKGYYYTDDAFELPRLPATQEEILSVLVARRLLAHSAGGIISEAIRRFGRKLQHEAAALGLNEARLDEAFSASWHGFSPALDRTFRLVAEALISRRLLELEYRSAGAGARTRRTVEHTRCLKIDRR